MCAFGYLDSLGDEGVIDVEYTLPTSRSRVQQLEDRLRQADLWVCFNAKYDLHWLRRFGIVPASTTRIWCCQLAEYLLSNQSLPYPALGPTAEQYGVGEKSTDILTEYWDQGISTENIPWGVISERVLSDVHLTKRLYLLQRERVSERSERFQSLVRLSMLDLLALEEMEWNGLKFDFEYAQEQAVKAREEIERIDLALAKYIEGVGFNWNSPLHKSALLYGGIVSWKEQRLTGVYKSGEKIGQDKYTWFDCEKVFPRLVNPLPKTELATAGYFSTDADTLPELKATGQAKEIIGLILERQKLVKLSGTYFEGIHNRAKLMGWDDSIVHGQYNQVVAVTGRLSASKPNLQNVATIVEKMIASRYA